MEKFTALIVEKDTEVVLKKTRLTETDLTNEGILIKVSYSGINFKDALATLEKGGVIRDYPLIPGIDLAGVVVGNETPDFPLGTKVLATGFGLGVSANGGFSQYQKVPEQWLVKLPESLSEKEAMIYGTAGFTAILAVAALEEKKHPKDAPIAITGVTGGVGSIALALLAKRGYTNLIAITRKENQRAWLEDLGASDILAPDEVFLEKRAPLAKQRFTAVIDTVGGQLLEDLLPQISYGGTAALCGNASGIKLATTVLPFILRGITLQGIDSVNVPIEKRPELWQALATTSKVTNALTYQEVSLDGVPEVIDALLAGEHVGRTIIRM